MEKENVIFAKNLDRYHGRMLDLKIEIRERRNRLSIDLEPVETCCELSICGPGGQDAEEVSRQFPDSEPIQELCRIWERWHLSGMRAGTRKQEAALAAVEERTGKKLKDFGERCEALAALILTGEYTPERRPAEPGDTARALKAAEECEKSAQRMKHWALHGVLTDADMKHARAILLGPASPALIAKELQTWYREQAANFRAEAAKIKKEGVIYGYGSLWLTEPLPVDVRGRVIALCSEIEAEAYRGGEGDLWAVIDGARIAIDSAETEYGQAVIASGRCCYVVFRSDDEAGEAAAEYWRDLKDGDPREFRSLIGDETLIAWVCGQPSGPGSYKANPAEHFATYDGEQRAVTEVSETLRDELGWSECKGLRAVAYRQG